MMNTLLITGASGFVGRALLAACQGNEQWQLHAAVRSPAELPVPQRLLGELDGREIEPALLAGIDVIVHCAARVHVMQETSADPLADFRAVNVEGSLALARAAAQAGVRRFVYISTVKVHGESSVPGQPLRHDSPLAAQDPYARSKAEAEQALRAYCSACGMELVIIRPPLVYGSGVGGNLSSLMRLIRLGIPLPLASIENRRSLVGLDNLVSLILCCARHPAAAGHSFLVSDGDDVSTPELVRALASAMPRRVSLFPLPLGMLHRCAALAGRQAMLSRLCESLQVDIEHTRQVLGWTPRYSLHEGIVRMFSAPTDVAS